MFAQGIHKLITSGHPTLKVIHDCMLTIVSNLSPYLKSVNKAAATKLLSLFETFASPRFICAAPHNPNMLFYLLETFNNLIQYQFEGIAIFVIHTTQLLQYFVRRRASILASNCGDMLLYSNLSPLCPS